MESFVLGLLIYFAVIPIVFLWANLGLGEWAPSAIIIALLWPFIVPIALAFTIAFRIADILRARSLQRATEGGDANS